MTPYLRARCGSLIRDTGADDLVRHEEKCPACVGHWNVFDRPQEDERLDSPIYGQADELNRRR